MTATAESIEAYRSIQGPPIKGLQLTALRLLRKFGPCTARELAERGQVDKTLQKRLSELEDRGLVNRLPSRTCSISGMSAAVWAAINPGERNASQSVAEPASEPHRPVEAREVSAVPGPTVRGDGDVRVPPRRQSSNASAEAIGVICACGTNNGYRCTKCGVEWCETAGHVAPKHLRPECAESAH